MTLEQRVARLERQNQRLRLSLVMVVALVAACAGVSANYERVRVRELVIVDADEKAVATFVGKKGTAELSVVEASGASRVLIDASGLRK